jgi:hypothetical protein
MHNLHVKRVLLQVTRDAQAKAVNSPWHRERLGRRISQLEAEIARAEQAFRFTSQHV